MFCFLADLEAQTMWSTREYRIPGLGEKTIDAGFRYSNLSSNLGASQPDLTTWNISINMGQSHNDHIETQITGNIGSTDHYGNDDYTNFDLGFDGTLKYEYTTAGMHKIVPFARAGVTASLFSNYEEHTVGYDGYYRYYTTSGNSYFDFYGNYSAGLAYVSPTQKWAVSSELGTYTWLGGDLDLDSYSEPFWSTHLYMGVFEESGIKLMYSLELDSEMSTWGIYWSKVF